jgi:hypothetical protein
MTKNENKEAKILFPYRIIAACAILIILLMCGLTLLCVLQLRKTEAALKETISFFAEENRENLVLLELKIKEQIDTAEIALYDTITLTADETFSNITGTRRQLTRLDTVYTDVLDAQKRKSLESLYDEDALTEKLTKAQQAFREGKYLTANHLYAELSEAQKDNHELRFYRYYALFLNNKAERDNYRQIREAFQLLEQTGYTRNEIREVLGYIEQETAGIIIMGEE